VGSVALVPVVAYYYDPTNGATPLLPENALMAADAAVEWQNFRSAMVAAGFEPFISPPDDPSDPRAASGYTKGFFRTPYDQSLEVQEAGDNAAPVDQSPHQAGRAFDLDLNALAAAFPDYDYGTVTQLAAGAGFYPTAAGEPWHFDDNPAGNSAYGSVLAAVQAIGNTAAQVQADQAAGQPTPQEAAISGSLTNTLLFIGMAGALAYWLAHRADGSHRRHSGEKAANKKEPEYVF
jgi:hypothetical protein